MTQSKYLNVDDFWIALKFDLLLFYVLSRQFGKLFLLMFYVAQYGLSEHSGNTMFSVSTKTKSRRFQISFSVFVTDQFEW